MPSEKKISDSLGTLPKIKITAPDSSNAAEQTFRNLRSKSSTASEKPISLPTSSRARQSAMLQVTPSTNSYHASWPEPVTLEPMKRASSLGLRGETQNNVSSHNESEYETPKENDRAQPQLPPIEATSAFRLQPTKPQQLKR